jgi:hypothetical protein
MRLLLVFPVVAILLTAAEAPAKNPAGIPAGAVLVAPGSYRYTDPAGTAWIYRQTPFGVARLEEKLAAEAPSPGQDYIRATEDGDTIRFERPGPFGPYRWQRKKSELSESERAIWDRQRSGVSAKQE